MYITSYMEKSENSSHDRCKTSENSETSSICSAKCTNEAYISASVNIVKISILNVSRQRHSSWNRSDAAALYTLDVLKHAVPALSETRFRTTQRMRQGTEPIVQTDSRTDSLVCQLV